MEQRRFLAGGGSGHGFKLSPILGEQVAANVLGTRALLERFRIGNRKVEKRTTQMEAQP